MSSKPILGYLGLGGIFVFLFYKMTSNSSHTETMNPIPNSSSSFQAPVQATPPQTPWWRTGWEFIKQSWEEEMEAFPI